MIAVSDPSPICYLFLRDEINLLPQLYGAVTIPQAVFDELAAAESPAAVQSPIGQSFEWLEIQRAGVSSDAALEQLDAGEGRVAYPSRLSCLAGLENPY